MRRQFHTSTGIVERELTDAEAQALAKMGDSEAKLEILRKEIEANSAEPDVGKRMRLHQYALIKYLTGV